MICLDTNYLILALVKGSQEADELVDWHESGEKLITPSIVWYEFLCGPVDEDQVLVVRTLLEKIVPFGEKESAIAAQLFNAAGRKRKLRVDAMIAATAIAAKAPLATNNQADFQLFTPHRLSLR